MIIFRYGNYKNTYDDEFTKHIEFYVKWQDEELKIMIRKDLEYWLKVSSIELRLTRLKSYLSDAVTTNCCLE